MILVLSPLGAYANTGHFSALICCYRSLPCSEINHLESWCSPVTLIKLCFASESCICSVCTVCKLYKLQEKLISVIQISVQLLKLTMNTNYTESLQCGWEALHTKHVTGFTEVDTKKSKNKQREYYRWPLSGSFCQKKSNSHPTLWILRSYYSGLNISVVSAMLFPAATAPLLPLAGFSYHLFSCQVKQGRWKFCKAGRCTNSQKIHLFYKTTEVFEILGLSRRSGIPHPHTSTHPRDNTWHYKSEHFCSIRKFLLELPKWPVPFVLPKGRTTPLPMLFIHGPSA